MRSISNQGHANVTGNSIHARGKENEGAHVGTCKTIRNDGPLAVPRCALCCTRARPSTAPSNTI